MATAPYGLEIIDNCTTCTRKCAGFFCDLAPSPLKSFEEAKYTSSYPSDALLFVEGQAPRGAYVICKGRVKLTMSSADGKSIILHIAGPGELIGLDAAMSGEPYGISAETLEPCQLNFIKRDAFLRLMREQPQILAHAAAQFGRDYRAACFQIRSLGLSRTASEKIARFLLETAAAGQQTNQGIRVNLSLTHEEIAQVVGVSRETVTRTFSDLKSRSLIAVKGPSITIRDKQGLEALAAA
jgi:CRP/FNR family cyclic AMP-dependent transcriptional regulator